MTYQTDDLDALVRKLEAQAYQQGRIARHAMLDAKSAITALRAQLAQVQAERDHWENVAIARDAKAQEANARADRAEAEQAAQIKADAGMLQDFAKGHFADDRVLERAALNRAAAIIRAQPHDRTALDRMLAEARAQALREAERLRPPA